MHVNTFQEFGEIPNSLQQQIRRASKIIHSGGVVIFPTKCLYGLAVDALNPSAISRIFDIKQRPATNPLLVLIEKNRQLDNLVKKVPHQAEQLMEEYWPGDLTIVFDAMDHLPKSLTASTGKIGIRMPGHPVAALFVKTCGCPITGTSANISGEPGCKEITRLNPELMNGVDMVIDAGQLKGGSGSTVIDVTTSPMKILREGEITSQNLQKNFKFFI